MKKVAKSPSVMCANLTDLENSIVSLGKIDIGALHIDIIDGAFSPSMPLGLETIEKLRTITDMPFDVHIMANNNEYFITELLNMGIQHVSFHYESSLHIDRYINLIKDAGAMAGIALNPSTSLSVLDYILPEVDTVVLMLINPGFAGNKNEKQVPYALKKIKDLRKLIDNNNLDTKIQVDGRVSLETIPDLVEAGADNLVLGSTSLFRSENTLKENAELVDQAISNGLNRTGA